MAKFEDRLIRDPLPLPTIINPDAIQDFDYRRVVVRGGKWRHDLEMLIGPRMREGKNGFLVVTPLEREDGKGGRTRVLVCRGWIGKEFAPTKKRERFVGALPEGEVVVEGLLREAWRRNMFTPVNKPESGEWYFPDVAEMARHSGSQEVWVEETMKPDLIEAFDREEKGIPIGRPAEVNLRNNHAQYIFTW
ncbi:MAG: hypothetical protein GOMPHAMPRED_006474 [Gomphillus americanus]|uniref:SURF1-like protein n=1 Tax=Gomphillus americanus TaxID=1940652 RepID=A0A8H3ITX6_9LECA|nr:MAG: hypothetical protein GOMPHAMPRED_006474 [Gomphillus americanus]